jgi:hypothetical protein
LDNAVVKLTGNQTIAGIKTFSSTPIVPSLTLGTQTNKSTIAYTTDIARTFTIPNTGSNADFVMTTGTQTISGEKTFSSQGTFFGNQSTKAIVGSNLLGDELGLYESGGDGIIAGYDPLISTYIYGSGALNISGGTTFGTFNGSLAGNSTGVSALTTAGDMLFRSGAGTQVRLPIGGNGSVLAAIGGQPGYTGVGTSGQAFISGGTGSPIWGILGVGGGGTGATTFTSGSYIIGNGTSALSSKSRLSNRLTSDFDRTGTGATNYADSPLSVTLLANKYYKLKFIGGYTITTAGNPITMNISVRFSNVTGTPRIKGMMYMSNTTTTETADRSVTINVASTTAGATGNTILSLATTGVTNLGTYMDAVIYTGTSDKIVYISTRNSVTLAGYIVSLLADSMLLAEEL